ncbi:hypothetical protein M407DRAFT_25870 [Tulasnella calospora MUT 4182]|uniref:Uncharacterized protein n=1 Tax=Tulasnella calospora MUT 4182 TaxID=1051891 RepID=A0A0C3Q648_9AGAM|nr:hypothetical protein M407DRAFT_25870 [Tulasnella calospora MUT 4182]
MAGWTTATHILPHIITTSINPLNDLRIGLWRPPIPQSQGQNKGKANIINEFVCAMVYELGKGEGGNAIRNENEPVNARKGVPSSLIHPRRHSINSRQI